MYSRPRPRPRGGVGVLDGDATRAFAAELQAPVRVPEEAIRISNGALENRHTPEPPGSSATAPATQDTPEDPPVSATEQADPDTPEPLDNHERSRIDHVRAFLAARHDAPALLSYERNVTLLCGPPPPYGLSLGHRVRLKARSDRARWLNMTMTEGDELPTTAALCERHVRLLHAANRERPLPTPRAGRRFASCAVVGSSGVLVGSGLGREIDRHAAVWRFNGAPSHGGFADDVGRVTTVRVCARPGKNCAVTERSVERHPTNGSLLTVVRACQRPGVGCRVAAYEPLPSAAAASRSTTEHQPLPNNNNELVATYCHYRTIGVCLQYGVLEATPYRHVLNPRIVSAVANLQKGHGSRRGAFGAPTSGLVGIGAALSTCDSVTLFGFANVSSAAFGRFCGHYYDAGCLNASRRVRRNAGQAAYSAATKAMPHDFGAQWRAISSLVDAGAVRYAHSHVS